MSKISEYLKESGVFYLATEDGDKPKVRPLGFCMELNGKIYLGIGKHKKSFQQILKNPQIEICTCAKDFSWIRINGKAIVDDSEEVLTKAFETMPQLKDMYNEKTGAKLGMLYIDDIDAEIADMEGNFEKVEI